MGIKYNPCNPCCSCSSGRICITVTDNCTPPTPIQGATITVVQAATSTTIGVCTTDSSGQCCIDLPSRGQYNITAHVDNFTDQATAIVAECGVDNDVTFAFGGVDCTGGQWCFLLTDTCSPSHVVQSGSITVSRSDGTEVSCTSDGTGSCCVNIPASCVLNANIKVVGANPLQLTTMGACGAGITINSTVAIQNLGTICVSFYECDETDDCSGVGHLVGGSITVDDGTSTGTATSDGTGAACLIVGTDTPVTVTATFASGGSVSFPMNPSACSTVSTSVVKVKTNCIKFIHASAGCVITAAITGVTTGSGTCTVPAGFVNTCTICMTLSTPIIYYPGGSSPSVSPVSNVQLQITTSGGAKNFTQSWGNSLGCGAAPSGCLLYDFSIDGLGTPGC